VYLWDGGPALVQTVDFFTPIVDDPYVYGQIAAANALSDVYAMGGRPMTALAIAGFPKSGFDSETIAAIFRGGFDKLREANVSLLGGHTVQDEEIKFGYAVTGAVDPARVLTNSGAQPGDALILTKPLGTGVVGTAIKFGRARSEVVEAAIASMRALNRAAAEALESVGDVHACTDITGFGLIGHAIEVAEASHVTLNVRAEDVPVFDGVLEMARKNKSGGMESNREYFGDRVELSRDIAGAWEDLLFDPQTSGGLLVAIDQLQVGLALQVLAAAGVNAARIGSVGPPGEKPLAIR
jgi:selenide, water dikinase